jgi:hypothetical protein
VLPFPFVLLGKNLFQPVRLPLCNCFVHESWIVKNNELLAAMRATPDRSLKSLSSFLDVLFALAFFRIVEYLPSFMSVRAS